jgi:hypothetical protein
MKVFVEAEGIDIGPRVSSGHAVGADLFKSPAAKLLARGKVQLIEPEETLLWCREMLEEEARVLLHPTKTKRPESLAGKLRARHHAIARMMVAGATDAEICRAVGCTPPTIAALRDSPAFMALYAEYAAMADEAAIDLKTRLTVAAGLAADEITRRLATESENIPIKELRDTMTSLLDRVGHGPTQKVENASLVLSLEDIREMKSARKNQVVIEHVTNE